MLYTAAVIKLARPYLGEAEGAAVMAVMASGMLVQGAVVAAFETAVLHALGAVRGTTPEAVAVTNGTTALELALATTHGAGVGIGDEVIVPALTWPSPGHAAILRGATPVLVDIDPHTWCVDPSEVGKALTAHTRAVIAIDQFGVPADVPAVRRVLPGGVDIVEDSACALGSSLAGVACGLLGDVGVFSFHPRKVVTTGEGGMLVTQNSRRAAAFRTLRNHGQASPGVFVSAGPNARLSEIHAAIGVAQMARLDEILARRRAYANEIRAALALAWQNAPHGSVVNHQTLGFVLPQPSRGTRQEARDALIARLRESEIEASVLSYALHRLPQFAAYTVNNRHSFPFADAVVDGGVAVPLHPGLSSADIAAIIDALRTHAAWALGRDGVST